jgi:hypothetical protein
MAAHEKSNSVAVCYQSRSYVMLTPVISLGTNCEIAFNIRRTFETDRAYPADWWITPIESVANIIRSRFDVSITVDNLEMAFNGSSVLNRQYGIIHHHDFPRDSSGKIAAEWQEKIPTVRQKYEYLAARFFDDVCGVDDMIFAINRDGGHTRHQRSDAPLSRHYSEIADALEASFPNLRFRLAIFNATDAGAFQACANDRRLLLAPQIIDYGDRENNEPGHFACSLKGWRESLEAVVADYHSR